MYCALAIFSMLIAGRLCGLGWMLRRPSKAHQWVHLLCWIAALTLNMERLEDLVEKLVRLTK